MCRHHVQDVPISHFIVTLTGQKTKAKLEYVTTDFVKFDWSQLQVDSPQHIITQDALMFAQRTLKLNLITRGDYEHLCEIPVFYLVGHVA